MFKALVKRYRDWRWSRACKRFAEAVFAETTVQRALRLNREKHRYKDSYRANSSGE
jgi:hypothetical protein